MPYEKTDYHDSGGGRIERADGVSGLCGYVEGCNGRWRYQRGAEKYASQEWLNLDGKRYYIGADGFMVTGWTQVGSQWYYMDESGVLQYGWLKDNDKWYYLAPDTGAMVTDTVIDGRQIGSDGVWVPAEAQTEPVGLAIDPASATLVQNMEGIKTNGYTIIPAEELSTGRTGMMRSAWLKRAAM